jgi:hypothetical protein
MRLHETGLALGRGFIEHRGRRDTDFSAGGGCAAVGMFQIHGYFSAQKFPSHTSVHDISLAPRLHSKRVIVTPTSRLWMVDIAELARQSPEPTFFSTLADLSRNASVISSSSDSETSTSTVLRTPRPRPTRTFSSPRSRSPHSPTLQSVRPPPAYLTRELGVSDGAENRDLVPESVAAPRQGHPRSKSRKPSRSRNPSANTRLSAQDFVFGETLGEGSYSTVRTRLMWPC